MNVTGKAAEAAAVFLIGAAITLPSMLHGSATAATEPLDADGVLNGVQIEQMARKAVDKRLKDVEGPVVSGHWVNRVGKAPVPLVMYELKRYNSGTKEHPWYGHDDGGHTDWTTGFMGTWAIWEVKSLLTDRTVFHLECDFVARVWTKPWTDGWFVIQAKHIPFDPAKDCKLFPMVEGTWA